METPQTTVLLIEDDEEDFILLEKMLGKVPNMRYRVLWEQRFEDGLAHLQQADHDICLLDYRLGLLSGIDLVQEARRQGYTRPMIVLTGVGTGDIDIQALQAGADDYITKDLLQGELLYRLIRYAIERRKSEQERERLLREQLLRDDREARRNEFIGMVVHELKTPLSSLKGYSQLMARHCGRTGDIQGSHMASRMDMQVNRLTGLINDLQDVNHIEGGRLRLHESVFDVDDLVKNIVADIQLTTEQHTIVIVGQAHATIRGDRERVGQILTNLLTNAIKYAPDSKEILVKLRSDTQSVTISVHDFGPGISKDHQARIFEPFYRTEEANVSKTPGLGLGLAIVAELVERHHGKISVESEEGKGTIFCFSLPLPDGEILTPDNVSEGTRI
jgi:signal transduction histidine kinase